MNCPFCGATMPGICGSWSTGDKTIQTSRCKERQQYQAELAQLRCKHNEYEDIIGDLRIVIECKTEGIQELAAMLEDCQAKLLPQEELDALWELERVRGAKDE